MFEEKSPEGNFRWVTDGQKRVFQKEIDDGTATRFIPIDLHKSVLKSMKREKELYEYILKLILNEHKKPYNDRGSVSGETI